MVYLTKFFQPAFLLLQHMLYRIRYQASLHQRNQNVNNPPGGYAGDGW
ncbi:hypothetical protein AA97_5175 [Escherichia coli 2-005-03_S1_C1]|nr:hypothetical protein AA97_5175 [Escherichia coli 2-005-03_S1_C1]